MGTKNNPKNRAKGNKKKQHNGRDIDPILYCGTHAGHGKYIAAKYSGSNDIIIDENKRPIPWDDITSA